MANKHVNSFQSENTVDRTQIFTANSSWSPPKMSVKGQELKLEEAETSAGSNENPETS